MDEDDDVVVYSQVMKLLMDMSSSSRVERSSQTRCHMRVMCAVGDE